MARETGSVRWFSDSKGFGFIARDGKENCDPKERDVFVHFSEIAEVGANGKVTVLKGFKSLAEGDRVEFDVVQGVKGLAASKVVKIAGPS